MEKKETAKKAVPIKLIAVLGIALVAVIAVIFFLMPKEEAYRQVQVYKVDGTADVEREQLGVLEAYANMMLQNQDIVNVSEDSNMQVKLDEDKYILLEPKTRIHLEATGNSEDSKTKIFLEEGAIVCNIEKPLSEDSTYEVITPNSTMAVRGTTFRVALTFDEAGDSYTATAVFEGKVESFLVFPDGNVAEEGFVVEKGTQVEIKGTEEESIYVVTNQEIPYEIFEKVTLEFLDILIEKGEELSIDKESLAEYIELVIEKEMSEGENSEELENTEMTPEDADATEEPETEATETEESEPEKPKVNETPETSETEEEEEINTGGTTTPSQPKQFTVTFTYNNQIFATQAVTEGKCATEPKLMPTAAGKWDFDFNKAITENTVVEWIDSSSSTEE